MKKFILTFAVIAISFWLAPEKVNAKMQPPDYYYTTGFYFEAPGGGVAVSCQGAGWLICRVSS